MTKKPTALGGRAKSPPDKSVSTDPLATNLGTDPTGTADQSAPGPLYFQCEERVSSDSWHWRKCSRRASVQDESGNFSTRQKKRLRLGKDRRSALNLKCCLVVNVPKPSPC
jgi:hypothetical protein